LQRILYDGPVRQDSATPARLPHGG
jgi:hypothetical protein